MLLLWEQEYAKNVTGKPFKSDRMRASVRVDLNDIDNFVRFHVSTNEVPNSNTGKDVVVDWYMMDDFNSDGRLWVDANGL